MSNAQTEVIAPKELIVPVISGTASAQPTQKGALYISGAKLYFYNGSVSEIITSA